MTRLKTWLVWVGQRFQLAWYWFLAAVLHRKADVSQISPQLWTGGAITIEAQIAQLVKDKITADIDCRLEFNDQSLITEYTNRPPTPGSLKSKTHFIGKKIAYCYDGVADDGQPKDTSWFEKAWTFADPEFERGGVVLAHCAAGQNRGPSMAYFLLRAHFGMERDEAFNLIKERRPVAQMIYRDDADRALDELRTRGVVPT